jgi:hypothetical protein
VLDVPERLSDHLSFTEWREPRTPLDCSDIGVKMTCGSSSWGIGTA